MQKAGPNVSIESCLINYCLDFFNKKRTPTIMKSPQIKRADMDFGPVISFTAFPTIISNVQTNIPTNTPSKISIIAFVFIFILLPKSKRQPPDFETCLITLTYLNSSYYLLVIDLFYLFLSILARFKIRGNLVTGFNDINRSGWRIDTEMSEMEAIKEFSLIGKIAVQFQENCCAIAVHNFQSFRKVLLVPVKGILS